MSDTQNLTKADEIEQITEAVEALPKPEELLKSHQQLWIDYCAFDGLISDPGDPIPKRMTVTQFAEQLNVSRETLYAWRRTISDFRGKVSQRRKELSKDSRASKVYNALYLRCLRGDPRAIELWSKMFDDYQPPAQKHDVTVSGLGDLVNMARKKNIIEGEVVDGQNSNT